MYIVTPRLCHVTTVVLVFVTAGFVVIFTVMETVMLTVTVTVILTVMLTVIFQIAMDNWDPSGSHSSNRSCPCISALYSRNERPKSTTALLFFL